MVIALVSLLAWAATHGERNSGAGATEGCECLNTWVAGHGAEYPHDRDADACITHDEVAVSSDDFESGGRRLSQAGTADQSRWSPTMPAKCARRLRRRGRAWLLPNHRQGEAAERGHADFLQAASERADLGEDSGRGCPDNAATDRQTGSHPEHDRVG